MVTSNDGRASAHAQRITNLRREIQGLEQRGNHISAVRLVCFLAAAIAATAGVSQGVLELVGLGFVLLLAFVAAVVVHARVHQKRRELEERVAVHERHLARVTGGWSKLPNDGSGLLPATHAYASDLDLLGPGSLFQRIDVTQTREGERALAHALGQPLETERIAARQAAVEELAQRDEFREQLEVLAKLGQTRGQKLDHAPFMALVGMPSVFAKKPWLKATMLAMVSVTALVVLLVQLNALPGVVVWLCVFAQGGLLWSQGEQVSRSLDLVTSRLGFAQAYEGMLRLFESTPFESPYLRELRRSLDVSGVAPSAHMARLARYEGFAQLRTQGPLYLVLNLLTMWDLFCLERIERFVRDVGPHCEHWFDVVGELEMLCSLATLRCTDDSTTYPQLVPGEQGFSAEALAHPLLPAQSRVVNALTLEGPGSLLVVTGSNMAGKSTLLRALGLNVALALAGGPVCARSLSLCPVRLRASMRIDDSLQRGASYFHAELTKLRMVVGSLDEGPPVLFLLDELLRGTNAHARNAGARAVLVHLLSHRAMGVVATHDVALSELEGELPRVHNVHFTDVFEDGEMRFDYKLRNGVVKTSNALRLLGMAGIEVPLDDSVA